MKIGIVGLGYVGLPLAIAFCEAGHEVVGVDTDPRVADALAAGRSHVEDVSDESLAAISERFHAELALRASSPRSTRSSWRSPRRSRATASPTFSR